MSLLTWDKYFETYEYDMNLRSHRAAPVGSSQADLGGDHPIATHCRTQQHWRPEHCHLYTYPSSGAVVLSHHAGKNFLSSTEKPEFECFIRALTKLEPSRRWVLNTVARGSP
ncbi:hypothetical protein AcW1_009502 [Taiwanofungus camphoratus]|nr:hypothetical protein AcW1_009502 [Antrodia cinnamomea]